MKHFPRILMAVALMFVLAVYGCPQSKESSHDGHAHSHEHDHEHSHSHGGGEHDRDGHEHAGAEGEESGVELALDETYNAARNGAHLYLAYNKQNNTFEGWVRNNSAAVLQQVRVEVHLSNGKELGPTTPTDLAPGQQVDVKLTATSTDFTGWTAHPEVGSGEHGHDHGEHGHTHGEHGHEY